MKPDANKLFVATTLIFAIAWIVCSALVLALPSGMMTLSGHMIHGNLGGVVWSMTVTGFFVGLITWSLMAGVIVWLIARFYDRLVT